jgi:SAM-dependent methyltransferase
MSWACHDGGVTRPSWDLDERAHAGSEHLDPAHVASYDAKAGADLDEELELLRAWGLGPETTLVDLGAGTGALALAAAPHCRRVVAVDRSPAMLAIARERAEVTGAGNLEPVEAGFLTYSHAGETAQLVHSRNARHLPDFWKRLALLRVHDLLHAGFEIADVSHRRGVYATDVSRTR